MAEKNIKDRVSQLEGRVNEMSSNNEKIFFLSEKAEMDFGELKDMLKDVKTAVVGDETMGHLGVIKRLEENEKEIKTLKRAFDEEIQKLKDIVKDFNILLAKYAAVGSVIGSAITLGITYIVKLFT